jgi:hypothetical protein
MKEITNLYDDLNWENADGYSDGTKRKVLRNDKKAYILKICLRIKFGYGV